MVCSGPSFIITWDDESGMVLEAADYPTGPWFEVSNATNRYEVITTEAQKLFRIRQPRPEEDY